MKKKTKGARQKTDFQTWLERWLPAGVPSEVWVIYGIYNIDSEPRTEACMYVGCSGQLRKRLRKHWSQKGIKQNADTVKVKVLATRPSAKEARRLEEAFIRAYNPVENRAYAHGRLPGSRVGQKYTTRAGKKGNPKTLTLQIPIDGRTGVPAKTIAKMLGCSPSTFYQHLAGVTTRVKGKNLSNRWIKASLQEPTPPSKEATKHKAAPKAVVGDEEIRGFLAVLKNAGERELA